MNLFRLALKNIEDNAFRSWIVAICAGLVVAFIIGATLVINGSQESMQKVTERLGADITVIPSGNQTIVEQAFLMGVPVDIWMDRDIVEEIAAMDGVAIVSPQLFLSTMRGASCCSVSDMFMVAYDPATDFTVHPWMEENLGRELTLGEAIGGVYISDSEGRDDILVYGYSIELLGNLEPTGSGLDQSLFFTYETAMDIARHSPMQAERELIINPNAISTALVRLEDTADPFLVAQEIEASIPGINAITSANLFREQRERVDSLVNSVTSLSIIAWVMALVLIGFVTSTAISSRTQEIGVLRVLGATRTEVIKTLLLESSLLTIGGSLVGIIFAIAVITLFRNLIMNILEVPIYIPNIGELLLLMLIVVSLSLASVFLATLIPILRISNQEPSTSIKE
ncbi:MAG: FtsX-like permease family protein [Anaerolineaceae bacterium]|jgi:putative ABC transport system permease protein|nr:FtsX-like permease family protein [Anaerolineaceae bacterium]